MRFTTEAELKRRLFDDENHVTVTSENQKDVEASVYPLYLDSLSSPTLSLVRTPSYFHTMIQGLGHEYTSSSASRPWFVYWIAQSLVLLGLPIPHRKHAVATLLGYQHAFGGFGGGPGQLAHLAATYAAVHALAILGEDGWEGIDRKKMYLWLLRLKQEDGGFVMHEGGEKDLRGTYCALTVASLLNLITPELTENCMSFILRCQSFDGGLSAVPDAEAHGGYTFCGLAASLLLGKASMLDLSAMLRWCSLRQRALEGGFQGRPNKLVDGCYTFWVGATFTLLQTHLKGAHDVVDRTAVQEYLLVCCQAEGGRGLVDKPGKKPDPYHTCYGLSGLSSMQHYFDYDPKTHRFQVLPKVHVVGDPSNLLNPSHPIYNIPIPDVERMQHYFTSEQKQEK